MPNTLCVYEFSPTGGTRRAAALFCEAFGGAVDDVDLMRVPEAAEAVCDLAVIAMPVYGGRIPAVAAERLKRIGGAGKPAVTLAVYGNRAYEDALLELNELAKCCGFRVLASAAVIAQHSVVPAVGAGRPDAADEASLAEFAAKVAKKLERGEDSPVQVPGSAEYKPAMSMPVSPQSGEGCIRCGACAAACPVSAVSLEEAGVVTDSAACMLCMACTAACPAGVRALPGPVQDMMGQMLAPFAELRKENEYFL